jgi:glyoxylase-like metal-dependent hydrolase (beta-lactamase superfamily II)
LLLRGVLKMVVQLLPKAKSPKGTTKILAAALGLFTVVSLGAMSSPRASAGTLHTYTSDSQGFDTHSYWYDDGQEVTLIDTQFLPSLTEAMLKDIAQKTTSKPTRVIVTHANPDKFNGLSLLHAKGIISIASQATAQAMAEVNAYKRAFWIDTAKAFTAENYPAFAPVKETFQTETKITLASGETLTLIPLTHAGVARAQTVVRIDASGDLLVGDLVHYKAHYWLEGGIVNGKPAPDLKAWQAALEELAAIPGVKRVYGGRGSVASLDDIMASEPAYLAKAQELVDAYLIALKGQIATLDDPEQAAAHYSAIEARFKAAFPERALSYLIGYGIYGLVHARRLALGL